MITRVLRNDTELIPGRKALVLLDDSMVWAPYPWRLSSDKPDASLPVVPIPRRILDFLIRHSEEDVVVLAAVALENRPLMLDDGYKLRTFSEGRKECIAYTAGRQLFAKGRQVLVGYPGAGLVSFSEWLSSVFEYGRGNPEPPRVELLMDMTGDEDWKWLARMAPALGKDWRKLCDREKATVSILPISSCHGIRPKYSEDTPSGQLSELQQALIEEMHATIVRRTHGDYAEIPEVLT